MERQEEDPNLPVRSRPHNYQGPTTEIISAPRQKRSSHKFKGMPVLRYMAYVLRAEMLNSRNDRTYARTNRKTRYRL